MSKRLLIAVFGAWLGSASLHAAGNILVASNRSNSLEEFTPGGAWVRTFATTGPYAPVALAQSPTTEEIFVTTMYATGSQAGQLTNRILRYQPSGKFNADWDTFTVECPNPTSYPLCPTTQTQSLLFDSFGNLWVATAYGEDLGGAPIYIFEYLATDLTKPNPPAQPVPIVASMFRGNQMAFNTSGDLCIAGFIDQDVKCFSTSTHAQTADYYAEIHKSGISPAGLAFDGNDRMYVTSVFGGQVAKEVSPGGTIVPLATLTASPSQLDGNLVLRGPDLYTTAFNTAPPTFSTPDPVYQVSTTGIVKKLIYETAPPALGNDHIWGAYWMTFLR